MENTTNLLSSDRQFKKSVLKDCLQILALYFFTVLVVYRFPGFMGYLLFILLFILFYKSEKDYFWLAFWFVINTGPGGFFYFSEEVSFGQLPVFKLGEGVNVSITEIFLAIAIFKALTRGKKQPVPFAKPLTLILVYSIFLFAVSFFVFGTAPIRFLKDVRYFLYYFFIIPLNYLVYKEKDGEKLLYCLFPFVFVTFLTALYFIFNGDYLINYFAPGLKEQAALGIAGGGLRYNMSGRGEHLILLISFISTLFFTFKDARLKRQNRYLLMVAGISYVTILFTATRLWFIVFTFIFVASVILFQKNFKVIGWMSVVAILFLIPYLIVPKIHDFSNRSWTRIASVFEINNEDSIAYKELEAKKKYRLAKTLLGIEKSPLIGLGSSRLFFEYTGGGDIGNFNLILQVGIIGFLLFINFWIRFFLLIWKANRRLSCHNPYRNAIFLFSISMIGLLISQFTTHQIFSMVTTQAYAIFIIFFLFFAGYFTRDALKMEYSLKSSAHTTKVQENTNHAK